jgi:hypothetical protein
MNSALPRSAGGPPAQRALAKTDAEESNTAPSPSTASGMSLESSPALGQARARAGGPPALRADLAGLPALRTGWKSPRADALAGLGLLGIHVLALLGLRYTPW